MPQYVMHSYLSSYFCIVMLNTLLFWLQPRNVNGKLKILIDGLDSKELFYQYGAFPQLPSLESQLQTYPTTQFDQSAIIGLNESIAQYCLWGLGDFIQFDNAINSINYFENFGLENGDEQMNLNNLGSKYDFYMANKEEMYLRLLTGYKYETVTYYDVAKEKEITEYKCGYEECGKLLQKPWNLLDHVRMHEGVKPYICQWWGKGFTQKGNLKKHARQHN